MTHTNKVAEKSGTAADDGKESRVHPRRSVLWPAKIKVGSHEFACQLWNLSLGGARLRFDLPLEEGTVVTLMMPGRGDIRGRIIWHQGEATGLAFDTPPQTIKAMFADRLHVLGLAEETHTG